LEGQNPEEGGCNNTMYADEYLRLCKGNGKDMKGLEPLVEKFRGEKISFEEFKSGAEGLNNGRE
jgi:hypothetical protein